MKVLSGQKLHFQMFARRKPTYNLMTFFNVNYFRRILYWMNNSFVSRQRHIPGVKWNYWKRFNSISHRYIAFLQTTIVRVDDLLLFLFHQLLYFDLCKASHQNPKIGVHLAGVSNKLSLKCSEHHMTWKGQFGSDIKTTFSHTKFLTFCKI